MVNNNSSLIQNKVREMLDIGPEVNLTRIDYQLAQHIINIRCPQKPSNQPEQPVIEEESKQIVKEDRKGPSSKGSN